MNTNKQLVTAGDLLGNCGVNFDPMAIDLSEVKQLSDAMPKDGNIDLNNAETLATKYLRGADICAELLAIATAHVAKIDALKKKTFNYAFLVKSETNKTIKTDKMRAAFAEIDEEYQQACEKYAEAIAFAKWVSGKYDSFNKMHYLCKKILERGYTHERASSWGGYVDENIEENLKEKDEDSDSSFNAEW
jgi:hypothetical protein